MAAGRPDGGVRTPAGERSPRRGAPRNMAAIRRRRRAAKWLEDPGMGTEGEALEFIAGLVRASKPEVVVETGTFLAAGTRAISEALVANGKGHLDTIENHLERAEAAKKLQLPRVTVHVGNSITWCRTEAPENIDLAFVDSGPPRVRLGDVRGLWPRIRGFLLVHDTFFYEGLYDAVSEICGPGAAIPTLRGLGLWQKDSAAAANIGLRAGGRPRRP